MSPAVRTFNRRVHIYAGLALLLFLMLFAVTGLLLNRHWEFTEFYPQRRIATAERSFATPLRAQGDVARAREIMGALDLKGDVSTTSIAPDGRFTVQATRPGENLKIEADLITGRATVETARFNGWGVARTLHTFIGVSRTDPQRHRDWWLTSVWALALDLTAVGMVLLVIGGLIEAWVANPRRLPLALAFGAGVAGCLVFVLGVLP